MRFVCKKLASGNRRKRTIATKRATHYDVMLHLMGKIFHLLTAHSLSWGVFSTWVPGGLPIQQPYGSGKPGKEVSGRGVTEGESSVRARFTALHDLESDKHK